MANTNWLTRRHAGTKLKDLVDDSILPVISFYPFFLRIRFHAIGNVGSMQKCYVRSNHAKDPEIVFVARASAAHPRHVAASMIELKDGSLFLAWMKVNRSSLEANDEAPSDIVAMISQDGGRSWSDERMLIPRGESDTAAYKPSLLRLQSGDILFRYEMYHHLMTNEELNVSSFVCWSKD